MRKQMMLMGLACLACMSCGAAQKAEVTPFERVKDSSEMRLRLGNLGGVHLLVQPGDCTVTIYKMEWEPRALSMRIVLVSPDRQVLADTWLPGLGPEAGRKSLLKTTLRFHADAAGVYDVMVTSPEDRYGRSLRWGFETSCPKYLIESCGGHKDERHQEPITLTQSALPGSIYFWPSRNAIQGKCSEAQPGGTNIRMLDDQGRQVLLIPTTKEHGTAEFSLPEDASRKAPWSLELKKMHGVFQMDGLTRWGRMDCNENLVLWTDKRSAWFDYITNHKLLTPYNLRMNRLPGENSGADFMLTNSGEEVKQVRLTVEYPDGKAPFVNLPFQNVTLASRESRRVHLDFTAPAEERSLRLRVASGEFTTYSSLKVTPKARDAEYAIETPLILAPYVHQNVRCAYAPDYPLASQPYFDLENRPYILDGTIRVFRDGRWQAAQIHYPDEVSESASALMSKIGFDKDNWAYVLLRRKKVNYYAYSADGGANFQVVPIPEPSGAFELEQASGHNLSSTPAPFAIHTLTNQDPKRIWRGLHDFRLFIPVKENGKIRLPEPIMITDKSIGLSHHSGIPSTIATFGERTYVIWGEATEPDDKSIKGVPTMLAVYDRATGKLERGPIVGFGPPANDIHNTPCLTVDGKGYIHALVGTHGNTFLYTRSLQPNSLQGGWLETKPVMDKPGQTYIGMICDPQDNVHIAFRLWGENEYGNLAQLAMMTKPADSDNWSEPRVLVRAPFNDYSVFYHRFVIDRKGNFYLSFDYWSTYWFYRNDQPGSWRSLILSKDGGVHWQMAPDWK